MASLYNTMQDIYEHSKDYDYLKTTYDPLFERLVEANEIVKQFIIDYGLIGYGGTAIDMALRLKGDKIYSDELLKVPDLDFYSPNNIEHAYLLADILYRKGFSEVRAIVAQHTETMKVDIADNHIVADISYRPASVFDTLPVLNYNGLKIIHPDFQRVDIHSSLSFPYDNVPREVIFARWSKDIKRFNKMVEHYPIIQPDDSDQIPTRPVTVHGLRNSVFCGFGAYAILYSIWSQLGPTITDSGRPMKASFEVVSDDGLSFDTIDQTCEIVHYDITKAVRDLGLTDCKMFEPFINLLPARAECVNGTSTIVIYDTNHRLVGYNSVKIGGASYRITNIQFVLKYFLSMYFIKRATSPKLAATYLARYTSLLIMIETVVTNANMQSASDDVIELFLPSVKTYGNDNINLAREIGLNMLYNDLDGVPKYNTPVNYYPSRSLERGLPHPSFRHRDLSFFRVEGREIESHRHDIHTSSQMVSTTSVMVDKSDEVHTEPTQAGATLLHVAN